MTKFLVVGRGEGKKTQKDHQFTFVSCAIEGDKFVSLENYDIVLQHISSANKEYRDAIQWWKEMGWEEKVVGFSGGDQISGMGARRAQCLNIPFIGSVPEQNNILEIIARNIPADYSGNAESLVNKVTGRESLQVLPALAILCQGYLAVHAANGEDDKEPLEPALRQMGWFDLGDDREKICQVIKNEKDKVESAKWWLAPFGLDGSENSELKWNEFEENLMSEKKGAGEGDWITVDNFINNNVKNGKLDSPEIIARVYCSLVAMLEGHKCNT